ncbi:MAG: DUF2804 domain-containing protein [Deltaproteobacteria bacterium]|nr:DUF2804 domain-containing protein [Deltaproteobacteria bacterium]
MTARRRLPEWLPTVDQRMAGGGYPLSYSERELSEPVALCDDSGRLNRAACGWARQPIIRGNLSGHWPRKKKWNFWNWICPRFVFSVTLADIDYAAFCAVSFTDFETGKSVSRQEFTRPRSLALPERVESPVSFHGRNLGYSNGNDGGDIPVRFNGQAKDGTSLAADFVVRKPPAHESLSVVVPWSAERFQLNCKENTRPCEGSVTVGDRRYLMDPADCHAVQDFGRGLWPYRSFWNWAVCTGVQDGRRIGVNVGAKWTTGTGANENAFCIDGRLYKIMEDLTWEYDSGAAMRSWRVYSTHSDVIDLSLQPIAAHSSNLNLGLIATGGICVFGRWRGTIRVEGAAIAITDLIGWAEEFAHRW